MVRHTINGRRGRPTVSSMTNRRRAGAPLRHLRTSSTLSSGEWHRLSIAAQGGSNVPEMSFDRLAASIRDERTGKGPSAPDVQALARQIMTEASKEIRETVTSAKEEMTRLTDQLLTKEARQVSDDVRRAILDQRTKLLNLMSGVSKSLREAETSLLEHLKP